MRTKKKHIYLLSFCPQTHLICIVPPFVNQDIVETVCVHLSVTSSGKKSESHNFYYTPLGQFDALVAATSRPRVQRSPPATAAAAARGTVGVCQGIYLQMYFVRRIVLFFSDSFVHHPCTN